MFGNSSGFGSSFGQTNQQQQQQQPSTFGSQPFGQQPQPTFNSSFQSNFNQQQQPGFGQGNTGRPQFGSSTPATTATVNNGTGNPVWVGTIDRDGNTGVNPTCTFQAISAMPVYKNWSIEELRQQDYAMGKKVGQVQASTGFGVTPSTGFGATAAPSTGFGNTASTGFGASSTFNAPKPAGFGFGGSANTTTTQPTSLFGGSSAPGFGQPASTGFGQAAQPSTGFGAPSTSTGFGFGAKPGN